MYLKNINRNLITSITPLRISLFGGGTDLESFINKNGYGKVITFAIDFFHKKAGRSVTRCPRPCLSN